MMISIHEIVAWINAATGLLWLNAGEPVAAIVHLAFAASLMYLNPLRK